jgi:hypothetical protein
MSIDLALAGNIPEILRIEQEILKLSQLELPITHYNIPGVYVRKMFIPAGTILTGKIHNHANIAILAQGTRRIANGKEATIISAPQVFVDEPGIKRLGFAETDVTFITVHRTDNTEIEAIEKELVSATFEDYEQFLGLDHKPGQDCSI